MSELDTTKIHNEMLLHLAITLEDEQSAIALIQAGVDMNAVAPSSHFTPLIGAAKAGLFSLVKTLLDAGADITKTAINGDTALHLAAATNRLDIATLLIEKGINIEAAVSNGETALHMAALTGSTEVLSLLLAHKANIEAVNASGLTPLHGAALYGNAKTVQTLLAAGAAINPLTEDGETPLVLALFHGQKHDNIQILLDAGADPSIAGDQVLHFAKLSADTGFSQAISQWQFITTQQQEKGFVAAPAAEESDIAAMLPTEAPEHAVLLMEV
jgi:ankyrin repeat protein